MEIFVDGVIYQRQPHGGISRLYNEILPRICDMDESLQITIFTDGPLKQPLPVHSLITTQTVPPIKHTLQVSGVQRFIPSPIGYIGRRLWYNLRSLWIGQKKGVICHTTYYTFPRFLKGSKVVTVYDMIHERFPDLYNDPLDDYARLQKRRCVQVADAVICISETTSQDVQLFYGVDSSLIRVIHIACSSVFQKLEQGADAYLTPNTKPFLLFIGKRGRYKNFQWFVQAYSVWSRIKEVALVVVGEPWTNAEKALLEKLGVWDQVHLLSGIDDIALCQLYNHAAAYVCPSLYEGFGIPILEAMACGCPIVASDIPSTIEVAGDCPYYFDLMKPESLLTAIDCAIDGGRDSDRIQRGFERAKQFSWDEAARKTLEVYYALK